MIRHEGKPAEPAFGAGDRFISLIQCGFAGQAKENPSLSATESISFRIFYLNEVYHRHLAGKPPFCQ
jgi:hypothetical protein